MVNDVSLELKEDLIGGGGGDSNKGSSRDDVRIYIL